MKREYYLTEADFTCAGNIAYYGKYYGWAKQTLDSLSIAFSGIDLYFIKSVSTKDKVLSVDIFSNIDQRVNGSIVLEMTVEGELMCVAEVNASNKFASLFPQYLGNDLLIKRKNKSLPNGERKLLQVYDHLLFLEDVPPSAKIKNPAMIMGKAREAALFQGNLLEGFPHQFMIDTVFFKAELTENYVVYTSNVIQCDLYVSHIGSVGMSLYAELKIKGTDDVFCRMKQGLAFMKNGRPVRMKDASINIYKHIMALK